MLVSTFGKCGPPIHPGDIGCQKQRTLRHQPKLDGGKIANWFECCEVSTLSFAETIHVEAAYFERNAERMRYPAFRRQHLFVVSGVVEAGCKTVVNVRTENYWESRRAA